MKRNKYSATKTYTKYTYEEAGKVLLAETKVRIGKYRKSMTGRAYHKTPIREAYIVCPEPKTAISFYVFAHEIGHIVANPDLKAPSWKREIEANEYSKQQFIRFGLKLPRKVLAEMNRYSAYSVCQALNRGMKMIPKDLPTGVRSRIKSYGYKHFTKFKANPDPHKPMIRVGSYKRKVWLAS